jgi:hypothetical protein
MACIGSPSQARRLRFHHFTKVFDYWRYRADPNGREDDAEKVKDDRRAHLSQSLNGGHFLDAFLDGIGGAVFEKALKGIEDELFEQDREEAKQRLGREPNATDLARAAAQRRADALASIIGLRNLGLPGDGSGPPGCSAGEAWTTGPSAGRRQVPARHPSSATATRPQG